MTGADRRQFTRAPLCLRANIRLKNADVIQGTSSDISLRGFFLECTSPTTTEGDCEATLFLSSGTLEIPVRVHGRVVRATPTGIAVEFTSIELEAFTHLKTIVKLNSSEADKIDLEVRDEIQRRGQRPGN